MPQYFLDSFNIIIGSYDNNDEQIIINSLLKTYSNGDHTLIALNHRIILVPHENDDNLINVLDVIVVVNMILGEISQLVSADLNLDGIVNVVDGIQLVNIILNN